MNHKDTQKQDGSKLIIRWLADKEIKGHLAAVYRCEDVNWTLEEREQNIVMMIEIFVEMEYDNIDIEDIDDSHGYHTQKANYLLMNKVYNKQAILDWVKGISWEYTNLELHRNFGEVTEYYPFV